MPRASKASVLDRERRLVTLRLRGWSLQRIAEEVGVSPATVARIVRRWVQEILAECGDNIGVKALQTRQLEWVVEEVMQEWKRSKRTLVTRKECTQAVGSNGEESGATQVKTEVTRKDQKGVASYLAQLRGALADIRKIWRIESKGSTQAQGEQPNAKAAEAAVKAGLDVTAGLKKKHASTQRHAKRQVGSTRKR